MSPVASRRIDWRWRLIIVILVPLFRLARWRIDVQGLEHVPRTGPALIAFNHHSYTDFIMLAWGPVLRLHRPVRFLAKREVCDSRWIGWVPRWVGAICVDRGSMTARAGALSAAEEALRCGDLVSIAPEQTISDSYDLLPFRSGVARLAIETAAPIVPCVGWGSHRFLTRTGRGRRVLGLPVTARFLPPMTPRPGEDAAALTERLRVAIAEALSEVQRAYPDGLPAGAPWVPARLGGGARPHAEVLAEHEARVRAWGERRGGERDGGGPGGSGPA
jgi:1-acyl-sn-glycerol-3-phosphate acyltransferase